MTVTKTKTLKVSGKSHQEIKVLAANLSRPINEVASEALRKGAKAIKEDSKKKGRAA